MPKCLACARGFIEECDYGGCTDESSNVPEYVEDGISSGSGSVGQGSESDYDYDEPDDEASEEVPGKRERRNKPDAALKDQQSTGRKRAAKLYPLDRTAPCEWRGKDNQGGGIGIRGCDNGLQQARHHGPDYNTLNNDPTNVSRICHVCHNRWHAANDGTKEDSYLIQYGHKPKQLGKRTVKETD